jgi:50S ribosomal subunit-associated GTPase HflX
LHELGVIISDIVVVLNKQDLVSEEKIKEIENQFKKDELEYIIISAKTNYGGNELLDKIRIKLDEVTKEFFVDYQSVALISNFLDWLKQSSRVETRKDQNYLYIRVTGRKTILSQFENQLKRVRADIRT